MRLLLTRPVEDSRTFADALAGVGVDALIAPLMTVENLADEQPDLEGVQALLFTSANGVRAFAENSSVRQVMSFAVGNATARELRDAGFQRVESAGGDVDDLARLVAERCDPSAGDLLHIAGTAVAGDLGGDLSARGFSYRRAVLYRAKQADRLPDDIAEALSNESSGETIDGVALFSPRSAVILENLMISAGFGGERQRLTVFALSENVANALDVAQWGAVNIAAAPNADALLNAVSAANEAR